MKIGEIKRLIKKIDNRDVNIHGITMNLQFYQKMLKELIDKGALQATREIIESRYLVTDQGAYRIYIVVFRNSNNEEDKGEIVRIMCD